jgi:hypothetical protein
MRLCRSIANAELRPRAARRAAVLLVLAAMLVVCAPARAVDLARHFGQHAAQSTTTVDHVAWERLLAEYVKTDKANLNRVDYRRFKAQAHDALRAYLDRLQKVAISALNRPEQFAYWVNLYNAKTIDVVLERYPVGSIREINISGLLAVGPWGKKVVNVEGADLSLDDIEHKILRPLWRDPRIHYAVNCASIGCPNLARAAYTGATLEAMLDAAAGSYVNSARGVSAKNGAVTVSRIYSWYAGDFGGSDVAVLEHLRRYASPEVARKLQSITRISGYEYDWRLNDTAAE